MSFALPRRITAPHAVGLPGLGSRGFETVVIAFLAARASLDYVEAKSGTPVNLTALAPASCSWGRGSWPPRGHTAR
jgi:hypothetical protein